MRVKWVLLPEYPRVLGYQGIFMAERIEPASVSGSLRSGKPLTPLATKQTANKIRFAARLSQESAQGWLCTSSIYLADLCSGINLLD